MLKLIAVEKLYRENCPGCATGTGSLSPLLLRSRRLWPDELRNSGSFGSFKRFL